MEGRCLTSQLILVNGRAEGADVGRVQRRVVGENGMNWWELIKWKE